MSSGRRVLLIEDNDDARTTLQVLLGLWGHEVEVAEDGTEGIQKAMAWRPEVIVSDIGLPGGVDGYEVARQVRAALGPMPFLIALTAYSMDGPRQKALASGFDALIAKPADPEELQRLLTQLPAP